MSPSVSPHGIPVVGRGGRGYRPDQVDRRLADLSRERDLAWERAARLTVLANQMTGKLEQLREAVAQLAPPSYETLGERAQLILAVAEQEAAGLRARAADAARQSREAAQAEARTLRESAQEEAGRLRAAAEEAERRVLDEAQVMVQELRTASRRDAKAVRTEAHDELREARERAAALLAAQERGHAERWEALERECADLQVAADARWAELEEYALAGLVEAERAYAAVGEAARHQLEEAGARGEEIIAQARIQEQRVERDTERTLREHAVRQEELRAHLEHIRGSLMAVTGRPPTVPEPDPGPDASRGQSAGRAATVPEPDPGPDAGPSADPAAACAPRPEPAADPERPAAPTGRVPGPAKPTPTSD